MAPGRVVVRLNPGCSDGDPLHVPASGTHSQVSPASLYLEKIGQQWMEQRGEARPGVQYILEALPAGYTMWQRPRPSDSKVLDKYLFGHPNHKRFDSPNRFYPHFEHLMDNNGSSIGCPCTVCRGSAGVLPRVAASPNSSRMRTSASRRLSNVSASSASFPSRPNSAREVQPAPTVPRPIAQGRPKKMSAGVDTTNVDQDGTPDVYRNLINMLRTHGYIDEAIREPSSPDWRAEQELLPKLLETLKSQQQWIPRNGDIVLYVRDLPEGVVFARSDDTNELYLYDEQREEFLGHPKWEAGLVTEVAPEATIADLVDPASDSNVSNSGLRVEPIPNPNDSDKALSKRHKYVPLQQTRPLFLWKELLHSAQDEWHPSIKNALALSSTLSLTGKYRFRGTWPNAIIYCHGIFVGSEMLAVGDTVRLLPNSKSTTSECSDIMSIKSIRLKWSSLDKASSNDYDEGRPYKSEIWIYGSAYTSDLSRTDKAWLSGQNAQTPRVADDYGPFQPLHPPDKELAVPYWRVLGRLYESDALDYFLGFDSSELPGLDLGHKAMVEARAFARKNDKRIAQEPNATWYWGDDRAEALNLHTINGLDVAKYNPERDVKALRKQYRIIDSAENKDANPTKDIASGAKVLRRFMAPTLPVRTTNAKGTSSGQNSSSSSNDNDTSIVGKKRTHVVDLDGDDSEEEFRQHTRVIDNDQARPSKKAKIRVVID